MTPARRRQHIRIGTLDGFDNVRRVFERMIERMDEMDQQITSLDAVVAQLQAAETDAETRATTMASAFQTEIDSLNAQIASLQSGPVSPSIASEIAALQAVASNMSRIAAAAPATT
jgi:Zn-dependent oligopeptidase